MTKRKIDTTHVLMIADMSGSMSHIAKDVRGGLNSYTAELLTKEGTYRLTSVVFDTSVEQLCLDAPLDKVPPLTTANYMPRGFTALLDAVGKTVTEFESRIKLRRTDRVLVVIQTDGEENASREWDWNAIQKLIKDREATDQWSFVYLGVGADTWAQARRMGVSGLNYVNTVNTSYGTQSTYSGLVGTTITYAEGATGGESIMVLRNTPGVTSNDNKGANQQ